MNLSIEAVIVACGVAVALGGFLLGRGLRPGSFGMFDYLDSVRPKLVFGFCCLAGSALGGWFNRTLLPFLLNEHVLVMLIFFAAFALPFGQWCHENGQKLAKEQAHSAWLKRQNDLLEAGYGTTAMYQKRVTPLPQDNGNH